MKKITLILGILLLLTNCKKLRSKAPLTIDITCQNPVDGSAFPGVVFKIYEVKDKFSIGLSTNQKKELIYTGTTDITGKANYEFDAIKNSKYSYEIFFDYSNMDVPDGEYYLNKTRDFDYLKKNETNMFDFDILPYFSFVQHIKNINCFDSNDKMRFRMKQLFTNGTPEWSFWDTLEQAYFHDCTDEINNLYKPQDIYIYIYEVESTKNGVISTYIDTFYMTAVDTFKIYY